MAFLRVPLTTGSSAFSWLHQTMADLSLDESITEDTLVLIYRVTYSCCFTERARSTCWQRRRGGKRSQYTGTQTPPQWNSLGKKPWLPAHPICLRFKDDIQVGKRKAEICVNNTEYNGQQRELWAWGHHGFPSMVLGSFLPNKYQQYSLLPYQKGNRSWGKSPQEHRDWRG